MQYIKNNSNPFTTEHTIHLTTAELIYLATCMLEASEETVHKRLDDQGLIGVEKHIDKIAIAGWFDSTINAQTPFCV